jgi:hypothetical protein
MIHIHQAILELYPQIKIIRGDEAFDENENPVSYDKSAAEAKLIQMQSEENAKQEVEIAAKSSALAKLAALGLTQEEVKALIG